MSVSMENQSPSFKNDVSLRAPIALFVYNRPMHTRQTIEALQKNLLVGESDLIIFSDAPKSAAQSDSVSEVRCYIRQLEGFKSITIIERDVNFGLARSIIEGVTSIVNEHGRVIVLEDDLVTSPYFLTYMNDALDIYQDEDKVMHISGYMYPIESAGLQQTFFLGPTSCWGWATWRRAWQYFSKDPEKLLLQYARDEIHRFNMDGSCNFWSQVEQNASGIINTWAVFWYTSVFGQKGLSLHPACSMVINIGHDATGENCTDNNDFLTSLASAPIGYFETDMRENMLARTRMKTFFQKIKPSLLKRILRRLRIV